MQVTRVADNGGDLTHLRITDRLIRISKLGMVEHIKSFYTELQNDLFMNGEGFKERGVEVRPPRTHQRVAARITVRVRRRRGERRREEPVIEGLGVNDFHIRNDIRTARGPRVRSGGLQNGREPEAALAKQNPVDLPAAYEKICDTAAIEEFLTLAEGNAQR